MDSKLKEAIKKAITEVSEVEIPHQEFKNIAFSKALDFYLYGSNRQFQLKKQEPLISDENSPDDFWGKLAIASEVEAEKLKDVYTLKDKQILLILNEIPGKSRAEKQRNLAVCVLFAFQEGFGQGWVESPVLAESAKHSKLYDTNKYAKNLKCDWFRTEGFKKGLKYRLSAPGVNHAKKVLLEITSKE